MCKHCKFIFQFFKNFSHLEQASLIGSKVSSLRCCSSCFVCCCCCCWLFFLIFFFFTDLAEQPSLAYMHYPIQHILPPASWYNKQTNKITLGDVVAIWSGFLLLRGQYSYDFIDCIGKTYQQLSFLHLHFQEIYWLQVVAAFASLPKAICIKKGDTTYGTPLTENYEIHLFWVLIKTAFFHTMTNLYITGWRTFSFQQVSEIFTSHK